MLAVSLVTWPPYPEARPCDVVGGMGSGGWQNSQHPVGEGFQCWSPPVFAGYCFYGHLLIAKSRVSGDTYNGPRNSTSLIFMCWMVNCFAAFTWAYSSRKLNF